MLYLNALLDPVMDPTMLPVLRTHDVQQPVEQPGLNTSIKHLYNSNMGREREREGGKERGRMTTRVDEKNIGECNN